MTQLLLTFLSVTEIRVETYLPSQAGKWDLETEISTNNSMW